MQLFEKDPSHKLEYLKIGIMRNWLVVNGKAVRQQSNQKQTTMVAVGTLAMPMYQRENKENINQVKVVFFLQVLQTYQLLSFFKHHSKMHLIFFSKRIKEKSIGKLKLDKVCFSSMTFHVDLYNEHKQHIIIYQKLCSINSKYGKM